MPAMIYNGKIYGASSTLADDIIYDNTNSGLTAGTVGEAIDELAINGAGSGTSGVSFVFNEDGSIKGYKTSIGGADTVFPFKGRSNEKIYALGAGVNNTTQINTLDLDVTEYSRVRICYLYWSTSTATTDRKFSITGDGVEIESIAAPFFIDNPTDGSYEYDITNVNNLVVSLGTMNTSKAYAMAAIALSNPSTESTINNSQYKNVVYGNITPTKDTAIKITTGFKPEIIFCYTNGDYYEAVFYNENISSTSFSTIRKGASSFWQGTTNIAASAVGITEITDDGFYYKKGSAVGDMHYVCLSM